MSVAATVWQVTTRDVQAVLSVLEIYQDQGVSLLEVFVGGLRFEMGDTLEGDSRRRFLAALRAVSEEVMPLGGEHI